MFVNKSLFSCNKKNGTLLTEAKIAEGSQRVS
jgi:hypothetical protein